MYQAYAIIGIVVKGFRRSTSDVKRQINVSGRANTKEATAAVCLRRSQGTSKTEKASAIEFISSGFALKHYETDSASKSLVFHHTDTHV
jgi:hypothetical protein